MQAAHRPRGAIVTPSAPGHALLLAACRGERTDGAPVWFMRQAGRSLPEYRAVRSRASLVEITHNAELAAEVTLQPVRRHGVDAAILFSDIVSPLEAIGVELEIRPGVRICLLLRRPPLPARGRARGRDDRNRDPSGAVITPTARLAAGTRSRTSARGSGPRNPAGAPLSRRPGG
jgi:hypothetical protein